MLHKGQYQKIDLTKTFIGMLTEVSLPPELVISQREMHSLLVECLDLEQFYQVIVRNL
jgi:hypothetical protein